MSDVVCELQTLSDGSQALVQNIPGVIHMEIVPDGLEVVSKEALVVNDTEFHDLATKAMTHRITIDTISGKTTLMKKTPDLPSQKSKQANAS